MKRKEKKRKDGNRGRERGKGQKDKNRCWKHIPKIRGEGNEEKWGVGKITVKQCKYVLYVSGCDVFVLKSGPRREPHLLLSSGWFSRVIKEPRLASGCNLSRWGLL